MPRFYHTGGVLTGRPSGTAGKAFPIAAYVLKGRAMILRQLNSPGLAPVATGTYGTITISLSLEER